MLGYWNMLKRIGSKLVLLIVMVSCLGACGGQGTSAVDKQLQLKQRSEGYIAARGKSDVTAMQQYYRNPGMAKLGNMFYKSSEIVELTITEDGKRAKTKLKNSIMVMGFTFDKAPQTLNWEWYENDWYLVVTAPSASPFGQIKSKDQNNAEPKK